MLAGTGGEYNINKLTAGAKIQILAQAMYGYGYSTPWSWRYQDPVLTCGINDFEAVMVEYDFLLNPDPATDKKILSFYVSEFTKTLKLKLFCLVS